MAENAVEVLSGLAAAAALGAAQGAVTEEDSLALRARAWFTEAWTHSLWVNYRREAEEDIGYYVGGEYQWVKDGSRADLDRLKEQGRAIVSINDIQATVDVLTGFERQNRFDPKIEPQGEEDEGDARLLTWLLKFVRDQCAAPAQESRVFEDGTIAGMGAVDIRIDWTEDPHSGKICLQRLRPGINVIWDPYWEEDELSDARYVIKFKRVFVKDLIAQYPDSREQIRGALNAAEALATEGGRTSSQGADAYGGVGAHPQEASLERLFYDATEDQVLVLEAWYRDYEDVWIVANKTSGMVFEAESGEAARAVAASDPDTLTAIRRQRRLIKMGVVLPAAYLVLEEDETPYDNDAQHYPIVAYIAKRQRDDIYGLVRNLKDPQRVRNKRESQLLDLIARFANMRPVAEENSLTNPQTLAHVHDPSPLWVKPGHQSPGWFVPPLSDLFRLLTIEGDRMKLSMREISGINADLLGARADDASGIAIARRQAQGQVIATVFFDNYRAFKKRTNERLARRIHQVFTIEQVVRLTNEIGESVPIRINPVAARGKTRDEFARLQGAQGGTDRERVLRNLDGFLKYDVVISEAPSTPTMRTTQLLGLLEVLRTLPALPTLAPSLIVKIVELLDIEGKAEILADLRARIGQGPSQPQVGPGSSGGGQLEVAGPGGPPAARSPVGASSVSPPL